MQKLKKVVAVMAMMVFLVMPCILFGACSSDHTPKTGDVYAFQEIKDWEGDVTDAQKTQFANSQQGVTVKFVAGNKMESWQGENKNPVDYEYTIDGKVLKVTISGKVYDWQINGDLLTYRAQMTDSIAATFVYKLVK